MVSILRQLLIWSISVLEEELSQAVLTRKANNGSAVLLDPRTGEVLAMANYPGYNPNTYNRYPISSFKNRAVSDQYEPGSTFKMVALALCLEQLNLNMERELVFCENGKYRVHRKDVKDHKNFGWLTARQVFEQSSNVGVIKLSKKFNAPVYYRYARDFGFGAQTGVDLPAETHGILRKPSEYSSVSIPYMSIGYEVAVSPLQLAAAYGAIANDGVLLKPYVVKRVTDKHGTVHQENSPEAIRRVVSPETARRMREILQGVVDYGTGTNAQMAGVTVAGKTGTAQKIDQRTKSYSSRNHVASFVGMFPVEAPRFVLLVVVNNPRKGYYGSQVAAPAFKKIAERIYGIPTDIPATESFSLAQFELPLLKNFILPVEGLDVDNAVDVLEDNDIDYQVVGKGDRIYRQEPAAFTGMDSTAQSVTLFTEMDEIARETMPQVTGLTMKEAMQVLSAWDIPVEVQGSGVVKKQYPGAGKSLKNKGKITLLCKPI